MYTAEGGVGSMGGRIESQPGVKRIFFLKELRSPVCLRNTGVMGLIKKHVKFTPTEIMRVKWGKVNIIGIVPGTQQAPINNIGGSKKKKNSCCSYYHCGSLHISSHIIFIISLKDMYYHIFGLLMRKLEPEKLNNLPMFVHLLDLGLESQVWSLPYYQYSLNDWVTLWTKGLLQYPPKEEMPKCPGSTGCIVKQRPEGEDKENAHIFHMM